MRRRHQVPGSAVMVGGARVGGVGSAAKRTCVGKPRGSCRFLPVPIRSWALNAHLTGGAQGSGYTTYHTAVERVLRFPAYAGCLAMMAWYALGTPSVPPRR